MNVCTRQNFLGGFTSSGYLDVNAAASTGWAFAYRRVLHFLNLLKRPVLSGLLLDSKCQSGALSYLEEEHVPASCFG